MPAFLIPILLSALEAAVTTTVVILVTQALKDD